MRHIPEAELHAYLDQALSRSQCVEIESHLAECSTCQAARNEIAALRDRITALLAKLAPSAQVAPPPPFETMRRRSTVKLLARRRRLQRLTWAASVVVSIGLGWIASSIFQSRREHNDRLAPTVAVVPSAPLQAAAPPARSTSAVDSATAIGPAVQRREMADTVTHLTGPARSAEHHATERAHRDSTRAVTPVVAPAVAAAATPNPARPDSAHRDGDLVFDGVWRTMSWNGAQAEAGGEMPPHIDGLPVVRVQVQKNGAGKRPTMVVAQQLTSGEVIRTIEGPANNVSRLLGRRVMTDPDPSPTPPQAPEHGYIDRTMAMQRGDRMLAITGTLPSDSLRAMMYRLNAELKRK